MPEEREPVVRAARSDQIYRLFEGEVIDGPPDNLESEAYDCFPFRRFTLYLHIESTGTGDHYICFVPQFSELKGEPWCDFLQDEFASLCYEDQDTADGLDLSFTGPTAGRYFRLRLEPYNVTGSLYFTITARVEFWS